MSTFTRKVIKVEAEDTNNLTSVAKTVHWRVTCNQDQSISAATLKKIATNTWDLIGDLA